MTTALYTHPLFLQHETGPGHAESPARLTHILAALEGVSGLERRSAAAATQAQLLRVHERAYLDMLSVFGPGALDADTILSAYSYDAALHAAGAVCAAVDAVMAGEINNAFCAVRPPGHHAEPGQAMGFCLLNNVAVGALQAQQMQGCTRVAVLDFDVHHGNGTQMVAWDNPHVFFGSSHQWPFYPGTGAADECGAYGNIVNAPLAAGAGSRAFRAAWRERILPACRDFAPDFILLSAGFDAHQDDPLGGLGLQGDDFGWLTGEILALAAQTCAGRVVSVLEGGYNLAATADSAAIHVAHLAGA